MCSNVRKMTYIKEPDYMYMEMCAFELDVGRFKSKKRQRPLFRSSFYKMYIHLTSNHCLENPIKVFLSVERFNKKIKMMQQFKPFLQNI